MLVRGSLAGHLHQQACPQARSRPGLLATPSLAVHRQAAYTRDGDCRHDGSGRLCLVCSGHRELF